MAGILSFAPTTPIYRRSTGKFRKIGISVKASMEVSETSADSGSQTNILPPSNFRQPEPKRFAIRADRRLDILTASLSLLFRLGTGVFVSGYSASIVGQDQIPPDQYTLDLAGFKVKETSALGPRPEKPIEIYEFERYPLYITISLSLSFFFNWVMQRCSYTVIYFTGGNVLLFLYCARKTHFSCPFCRKVREIVSILDLDVLFYPCPRNGPTFRPKVVQMGGKQMFPYMVDPNTGVSMYESDDIMKYLVERYGDGKVPLMLSLGVLTTLSEGFAMIGRIGKGTSYTPAKMPPKPLEIWAYEGSPFCKVVREALVELELPHVQHSCARGSPKRQPLFERVGHFQVPYLEDPNTGVQMFESADIVDYLRATYAL